MGLELLGVCQVPSLGNKLVVLETDYTTLYIITRALACNHATDVAGFLNYDVIVPSGGLQKLRTDVAETSRRKLLKPRAAILNLT